MNEYRALRPGDEPEPPRVPVFLTVGIRISAGAGPGVRYLLPAEAAAIVNDRHGVYGNMPPAGYLGSTETTRGGIFAPDGSGAEIPR